jgi:acetyltransferase-like isoleucine patch superfamily enzyme
MKDKEQYAGYEIGEWTYGDPTVLRWNSGTMLRIGKFCSLANGVKILLGGEHRTDWISTYPFNAFFKQAKGIEGHPASKGHVVIGNDVWIGADALILSGVTIGDGAIVGAGSVVTKSIPAYSIFAGNPAKQIRQRFDQATIDALVRIAWWNWPLPRITDSIAELSAGNVTDFVRKHDSQPFPAPV